MKAVVPSSKFVKDVERVRRQKVDFEAEFEEVVKLLASGGPLPRKYKDHKLVGKREKFRDCHLKNDLVLVYSVSEKEVYLARLGSHAEVFRM